MDSDEVSSKDSCNVGCNRIEELVRFEQQLKNRGRRVDTVVQEDPIVQYEEEAIPISHIKMGFIRWAKNMDNKADIMTLMSSLTAILDNRSWTENHNRVLDAALREFETAKQLGSLPKTLGAYERRALVSEIEVCFTNAEGKSREEWAELFVNTVDGMNNSGIYDVVTLWSKKHLIMQGYATWSRLGQPLARYKVWHGCGKDDNDKSNWNKAIRMSVL